MNLFEEFLREIGLIPKFDVEDIDYVEDYSGYNYVDGEEGDNGIIKYFCPDKKELLAVRTIHGGDSEDIEFTEYAKEMLTATAITILKKNIDNLLVY
jgi:hypothetical protein